MQLVDKIIRHFYTETSKLENQIWLLLPDVLDLIKCINFFNACQIRSCLNLKLN